MLQLPSALHVPCQAEPDLPFVADQKGQPEARTRMKALCGSCPRAEACLLEALPYRDVEGIWGGHTSRERERLRRTLGLKGRRLRSGMLTGRSLPAPTPVLAKAG